MVKIERKLRRKVLEDPGLRLSAPPPSLRGALYRASKATAENRIAVTEKLRDPRRESKEMDNGQLREAMMEMIMGRIGRDEYIRQLVVGHGRNILLPEIPFSLLYYEKRLRPRLSKSDGTIKDSQRQKPSSHEASPPRSVVPQVPKQAATGGELLERRSGEERQGGETRTK